MKRSALALAALLLLPAAGASARDHRGEYQPRDGYARYDRGCRPLCQFDDTPCDPISFKLADGRCKNPFWRQ